MVDADHPGDVVFGDPKVAIASIRRQWPREHHMAIEEDLLDYLLAGRDPKEVFNKDWLVEEPKKALASSRRSAPSATRRSGAATTRSGRSPSMPPRPPTRRSASSRTPARTRRPRPPRSRSGPRGEGRQGDEGQADAHARRQQAGAADRRCSRLPKGATIDEIVAAFGWQPHTVRGAIAGALKKKLGLEVTSEKIEGRGRVYHIAS